MTLQNYITSEWSGEYIAKSYVIAIKQTYSIDMGASGPDRVH